MLISVTRRNEISIKVPLKCQLSLRFARHLLSWNLEFKFTGISIVNLKLWDVFLWHPWKFSVFGGDVLIAFCFGQLSLFKIHLSFAAHLLLCGLSKDTNTVPRAHTCCLLWGNKYFGVDAYIITSKVFSSAQKLLGEKRHASSARCRLCVLCAAFHSLLNNNK